MQPYIMLREELVGSLPRPCAAVRRKLKRADRRKDLAFELRAEAEAEAELARELKDATKDYDDFVFVLFDAAEVERNLFEYFCGGFES